MSQKQGIKQGTWSLFLIAALAVVISLLASSKIVSEQKVIARRAALSIQAQQQKPEKVEPIQDRSQLFSIRKSR